jgi:hypothetical protein
MKGQMTASSRNRRGKITKLKIEGNIRIGLAHRGRNTIAPYIIPYININILKWENITNVVIFLFEVNEFKYIYIYIYIYSKWFNL